MIRKRLKSTFWKTHFWNFYFFQKSKFRKSRDYRRKNSGRAHIYTIYMDKYFIFSEVTFTWRKSEKPLFQKFNFDKNRICQQNKDNYRMEISSELLPQDMSSRFTFHSTFSYIIKIIKKAFYISILYRIIFIRKQDYISRKPELL